MKLNLTCLALGLILATSAQAQTPNSEPTKRRCATEVPPPEWDAWFNQKVEEQKLSMQGNKTQAATYTIPVIVHVIYGSTNTAVGQFPNLSQAQINSQIGVLNNDFAGTGFGVAALAATGFSTVGAADCSIAFCLAQLDPNGNFLPEPGIDRISWQAMGWTNPASSSLNNVNSFQNYMNGTIKPASIWDPTRYLNIWVSDVNASADLLGYATFPINSQLQGITGSGGANTDGVWVWGRAFGNVGTLSPQYNLGRTATHEIGHWLGLRHIWGDSNCGNDFCADTPVQMTSNQTCPTYPANTAPAVSCGSQYGDMFMNFMDYCYDNCLSMFTPGQAQRMNTAMINGTYRMYLTASSATLCGLSAAAPTAAFSATNVGCIDQGVALTNQTTGTPPPSYLWSAQPSAGVTFSPNNAAMNPTVNFALNGTYSLVLIASNAGGATNYGQSITINECQTDVGIGKLSAFQKNITLAPNPSNGMVEISVYVKDLQDLHVTVSNYLGQTLSSTSYNPSASAKYTLDLNSYVSGVYFITLHSGSEKAVKRVVLNK